MGKYVTIRPRDDTPKAEAMAKILDLIVNQHIEEHPDFLKTMYDKAEELGAEIHENEADPVMIPWDVVSLPRESEGNK